MPESSGRRPDFLAAKPRRIPALVAGIYDPLTALLACEAGWDGLWLSGFCVSASSGKRDDNSLSLDQLEDMTAAVKTKATLPLICDAGVGFGNPEAAMRRLLNAGASAVCIEDGAYPKKNGLLFREYRLRSTSEMAEIYKSLVSCCPVDGTVIARTDALLAHESERQAYERICAYIGSGIDALIVHSKSDTGEDASGVLRRLAQDGILGCTAVGLIPTRFPQMSILTMAQLGTAFAIYANQMLRAAVRASSAILSSIKQNGRLAICEEDALASMADVERLIDCARPVEYLEEVP